MTGREKIEATFSPQAPPAVSAIICYEGIYIRDHWHQVASSPWRHREEPDIEPPHLDASAAHSAAAAVTVVGIYQGRHYYSQPTRHCCWAVRPPKVRAPNP